MPLKLYQRGKVWHFRGTVAGRQLRGSARTTDKKRAERIAAEAEARAWSGHLDGPGANLTMAQAFIAYRQAEKPTRFLEKVEDYWKDTPVSKVSAGAIRQSAIALYPSAKASTRNRQVIAPTQAAINHCAEMEWCQPIKVKRFGVETKPKKPVTEEWVASFQDNASPHLGGLCRFMFETGARRGEAIDLKWDDIDFDTRQAVIGKTKNKEGRIARLTPNILAALANIPSNRCPDDPVFQYLDAENVRKAWDAAVERANIDMLTPHSCRHGFATTMLRRGVDVKTVARWGGWKDPRVLLETYAHAIDDPTVVDEVFSTKSAQSDETEHLTHSTKREIS